MSTHTIRIDDEVKAALDAERLPGESNYNAAILRLVHRGYDRTHARLRELLNGYREGAA